MVVSRRLKNNISANYNNISVGKFSSKTKIGKNSWYFYVSLTSLQLQKGLALLIKKPKEQLLLNT